MNRKHHKSTMLFLINLIYVAVVTVFYAITWYVCYANLLWKEPFWRRGNYVVILLFALVFVTMGRLYGSFYLRESRISEVIYSNFIALLITGVIMYFLTWLLMRRLPSLLPTILYLAAAFAVSVPWAWFGKCYLRRAMPPERILLLYDNEEARANGEYIIRKMFWRFELVGQRKVTERTEETIAILKEEKPEAIMVCGIHSTPRNTILKYCVDQDIPVFVRPNIGDFLFASATEMQMANLPVMLCKRADPRLVYAAGKRLADIILSLAGLIVLSPVMLVTAIAIKLCDHGPVFYAQERMTKNRKIFSIYKFRSMRVDAEKDGVARLSSKGDRRITPVGRLIRATRIDEIPQLFCVLKGDMSLVGPRPERPEIVADYEAGMPEFSLRLQAKAGLTGYAQVYGKYNTEPYDKLQMDLHYISRQSFATDLRIILMTIKILFMPESTEGIEAGQTTAKK